MFNALASMFCPSLPRAHIFDQVPGSIELITLLQDVLKLLLGFVMLLLPSPQCSCHP